MPKPIRSLCRGERTWVLCREIPEDEHARPYRPTATALPRDVEVEDALAKVQSQLPEDEIRVLNWHRPKRGYAP